MKRKRNFYIVRLRKDDRIVATGTAGECAKALGFKSAKTFYMMVSKHRHAGRKRYEVDIMPADEAVE